MRDNIKDSHKAWLCTVSLVIFILNVHIAHMSIIYPVHNSKGNSSTSDQLSEPTLNIFIYYNINKHGGSFFQGTGYHFI